VFRANTYANVFDSVTPRVSVSITVFFVIRKGCSPSESWQTPRGRLAGNRAFADTEICFGYCRDGSQRKFKGARSRSFPVDMASGYFETSLHRPARVCPVLSSQ
jgi:hypothetical protein